MSMSLPVAPLRITRDLRRAEAALDDTLLEQTTSLVTLITARRETGGAPFLSQAELMQLVRSHQSLLSGNHQLARVHGSSKKIRREQNEVGTHAFKLFAA